MRSAIIENGIVVNVIVGAIIGSIECPDDVGIGYVFEGGAFTAPPPDEPGEEPEAVVIVFAVDLWSRMTNAEAEAVEAAMIAQPARIQNIFRAANSYRSDHELWPLLVSMATGLFGAPRAAEILAAS